LFGLVAVTAMLVCYAFESRSPWFILAFAVSCAFGSVYGFLQGAWPFGVVEAVWSLVAVRRWRLTARSHSATTRRHRDWRRKCSAVIARARTLATRLATSKPLSPPTVLPGGALALSNRWAAFRRAGGGRSDSFHRGAGSVL
jgi:hypothetical protein